MEINDILDQFRRLCNTDYALLQHHLASNSVVEWFGRTIRGQANICSYYRYDLCQQYEHCFDKADPILPFEYKPSHMQTKKVSSADIVYPAAAIINETETDLVTPLRKITTPVLPKAGKEKFFVTTPEVSPNQISEEITPPPIIRNQSSETDAPAAKRFKFTDAEVFDCDRDEPSTSSELIPHKYVESQNCDTDIPKAKPIGQGDCISTASNGTDTITSDTGYTDLMYLESDGFLRVRNKLKHRGIANVQYTDGNISPASSPNSNIDLKNANYERKTKLKISYRIRRHDNQLQFALIIYEHLTRNPTTRRNLLHEFQRTTDPNDTVVSVTKRLVSPKVKPKKSLKRTLRLF